VSLDNPSILPGGTTTANFLIISSKGHAVPAALVYDSALEPNFSARTQFRTVSPGDSIDLPVPITCDRGTPEGDHNIQFELRAQDGSEVFDSVQLTVTVTRSVTGVTNLPSDLRLKRGDNVLCEIRVTLSGSPAQFRAGHSPVPLGLSVEPDQRSMIVDG